jgi:aspartate aminotransferase
MPNISNRALHMPPSPVRKLVPFALQAKQKGIKVYHLNIGQPDIETPETALNALKNIDLKYWNMHFLKVIRLQKSPYRILSFISFSDLTPDNFIVTNGGSEALNFAISTLCDDGDEVIIPEPYYANYNGFTSTFDVNVVAVSSTIDTGFALPPIEEFEKNHRKNKSNHYL